MFPLQSEEQESRQTPHRPDVLAASSNDAQVLNFENTLILSLDRREVAHKREQELIGKMQKLRAEGLSYWKVVDVLNAWGIPTKTKKGKWSAKQVHQILCRISQDKAASN